MDITKRLDEIIFRHGLDKLYPRYRKMRQAEKAIRSLTAGWNDRGNVVCISIGKTAEKRKLDRDNFYRCTDRNARNCITFVECARNGQLTGQDAYDFGSLEKLPWEKFDRACIISSHGASYVGHWLRTHGIPYQSLYDLLALQGILGEDSPSMEWHDFIADDSESCFTYASTHINPVCYELHEQKSRLDCCRDDSLRQLLLQKMVFLYLAAKEFSLARESIDLLCGMDSHAYRHYREAWQDIAGLLEELKTCLGKRTQEDVVAFWVDGISYEEATKKSSFISGLQDRGVWLENMVTVTSFTRETYRTLFTGKKLLDDDTRQISNINKGNSPLLAELEDAGYSVRIVSGFGHGTLFAHDYYPDAHLYVFEPCSVILWETLRQMAMSDDPVFALAHLVETHHPYLFLDMDDRCIYAMPSRMAPAYELLDRNLAFYTDFLGRNVASIFFSDHGKEHWWPRQHVFMGILGFPYRPARIKELCSNLDFHKIIGKLIHRQEIAAGELEREYVEIQGMAALKGDIGAIRKNGKLNGYYRISPPMAPYRGIATRQHVYFCFGDKREWLARRGGLIKPIQWFPREEDIADAGMLPYFRKLARADVEAPNFGWESDFYRSIEKIRGKSMGRNLRKIEFINMLVHSLGDSPVAIYGGGLPSRHLYLALSAQNRRKIDCIIDDGSRCLCANLPVPVVPISEICAGPTKFQVIYASREISVPSKYAPFFRKCGSIDVYRELERNGVHCKRNFWDYELADEDFSEL